MCTFFYEDCLIFTNCEERDEIPHHVVCHLGLHSLHKTHIGATGILRVCCINHWAITFLQCYISSGSSLFMKKCIYCEFGIFHEGFIFTKLNSSRIGQITLSLMILNHALVANF